MVAELEPTSNRTGFMKSKDALWGAVGAIALIALLWIIALGTSRWEDYLLGMGGPLSEPMRLGLMIGKFIQQNVIMLSLGVLILVPMVFLLGKSSGGGETDS
jgi:uncharacterized membrane protein